MWIDLTLLACGNRTGEERVGLGFGRGCLEKGLGWGWRWLKGQCFDWIVEGECAFYVLLDVGDLRLDGGLADWSF